ncbi:MAG TPA: TlpA disulfide reductase family protein [Bryobacterales bacterium]|nr:TlpA disulfide reductase family protein [Bryobacterales bacterium]
MLRLSRFSKLAAAAAILLTGLAWAGEVPRPAPPLTVKTLRGEPLSLESLRGKVVLLEFFLTTCPHCQRTAGTIEPIWREYRSRGLEVLAVAINPDAAQLIPDFRARFGSTYPMALGSSDQVKAFAGISPVKTFFVPYIFLIDRKGVIRYEHPGEDAAFYQNENTNMRAEVDALVKEGAPARKSTAKAAKKG